MQFPLYFTKDLALRLVVLIDAKKVVVTNWPMDSEYIHIKIRKADFEGMVSLSNLGAKHLGARAATPMTLTAGASPDTANIEDDFNDGKPS